MVILATVTLGVSCFLLGMIAQYAITTLTKKETINPPFQSKRLDKVFSWRKVSYPFIPLGECWSAPIFLADHLRKQFMNSLKHLAKMSDPCASI